MKVAVAVITDAEQRFLITQRPLHTSHGGIWEFPGGKLENGEHPACALIREIKEEVGVDVLAYGYLGEICHHYDNQDISLLIYHVFEYKGEAICREGQMDLRWVGIEELADFQFPAANLQIIEMIKAQVIAAN